MSRFWRILVRIAVLILTVTIVATSLLIWRLSTGPLTTSLLTPYIASTVNYYIKGTHTDIVSTVLSWDNVNHSIDIKADNILVHDKNDIVIADVPHVDIQLSALWLALGQFLPLELTVDHPHFKLERDPDGVIRFGAMSSAGKKAGSGSIKDTIARITDNLAHALVTHRLQVTDAIFDVEDQTSNSYWLVHIPEISLDRVEGELTGHLAINVTQKDQAATVEVHYQYDRRKGLHRLDTKLDGITPSFFAGGHPGTLGLGPAAMFDLPISGSLAIAFDGDLNIEAASLDMSGHDGRLNNPDFWDQPRDVKTITLKADYDRETGLNISAADIDFGGPTLKMTAEGTPPLVPTHDLDFVFNVQLDDWPMDKYGELWPKPIITNARDWIAKNMSKGRFDHGEGTFKGELSWNDLGNMNLTSGEGKVRASGGRVHYMDDMPPVENVGALATFDLTQMTVKIEGGNADSLKVLPFALQMTGFEQDVQYIDIPLQFSGTIPDVMKFIDAPRLRYAQSVGINPDDINGAAKGTIELDFPLLNDLQMKDVDVKGAITLTGVASSKLIKGIDITQGNLDLALDKTSFTVAGPAVLNKITVELDWKQYFNKVEGMPLRQATVKGFITDDHWSALGIEALAGTRGAVPVTVELTQPDADKTIISGKLDMTAAEVHVDQLNWIKPSNMPTSLKFTAETSDGKPTQITSIDMQGVGVNVSGNATLGPDGHLTALKLDPFIIGRTNASLQYEEAQTDDHTLSFNVEGTALDVSGLKGGNDPEHNDPRPKSFTAQIGKVYTSDDGFIADAKGHAIRDPQGWLEIALQGMAQGDHKLNIDLASKDGRRYFGLTCDDFGKALQGMGFTDTVSGGKLEISGQSPPDKPRTIVGQAKIGGFTAKNLPALAILLNATSPFGFSGILTDSADFNSLKGKFTWEGDAVDLSDVRVAGPSVGMNIDGKVDMNSGNANLWGTLVPFSTVNSVLGSIPIIGDVLTGGKGGGILAVAYSVKGPLAKPDVNVNPISLLTPGFLRNLFFGGDSSDDTPPAPQLAPQPPAKAGGNVNINKTGN